MRHPSPYACPRCQMRLTFEDLDDQALGCDACDLRARLVVGSRALCDPASGGFVVDLRRF